jgi:RNA polymerase sigma factor (sigma-70 family)
MEDEPLTDERRALAESHRRFACWIVKRRFPHLAGQDLEEATAVSLAALSRAAKFFEPSDGFTFRTYAGTCCVRDVLRWLLREGKRGFYQVGRRVKVASLNAALDPSGFTLADVLAAPENDLDRNPDAAAIVAAFAELTPRRRQVMRAVYVEGLTRPEVAKRLGIDRSAVAQMVKLSLEQLRERFRVRREN